MGAIAEDVLRTGTLAASNDVVELSQPGTATVMVQLVVTGTNTTVFEVNVDQGASPNWVAVNAQNVNTGAVVASTTASGIYRVDMSGAREFRVRCSSYASGSAVVSMNGSVATAASPIGVVSSSGGGTVQFAEDAAHTSGDLGTMVLAVRQDTQSALAGTTADYIPLTTDSNGSLRAVSGGYAKKPSCTFTRPANTTAYTAEDEVGTSGTAPTTITVSRNTDGTGWILGGRLIYSSSPSTTPDFRVYLFTGTVTLAGDNAPIAISDSDALKCIGILRTSLVEQFAAATAGAQMHGLVPVSPIAFECTGGVATLWACIKTAIGFTPIANSETLTLLLDVDRD